MKSFIFTHKNSSAVLVITADDIHDAHCELRLLVIYDDLWRCDNEDGEDID